MKGLLELITRRRSARMPFDPDRPVSPEALAAIIEAARWAPTAHNMQNFEIVVVDDPQTLSALGNIDRDVSEVFVRENYPWLSFSEEELQNRKRGIMGTMFPRSWQRPDFRLSDQEGEPDETGSRPLQSAPLFLFVLYDSSLRAPASEGDFLGIMSLGCVMENMWLTAESHGLGFHVVSSLASPKVEPQVGAILGFQSPWTIGFVVRLGHRPKGGRPYVRVRRDPADFVHHNHFGGKEPKPADPR